jgi:transcriptional antiterminator RfaH
MNIATSHDRQRAWCLVQHKPNAYQMAARNLRRQGFPVFLPMQEETRRRAGRFRTVTRPLFSGYMFTSIGADPLGVRKVNSTYGVSRLVRFGNDFPRPMPSGFMDGLFTRCDADGCLLSPEELAEGDRVRLTNGPFADFITRIEHISPDQRIWVLLDIMGQQSKVSVNHDDLVKL